MPKYSNSVAYTSRKGTSEHRGAVKYASQTQANAGVADDVAISPKTLDAAVDSLIQDASTTVKGKIRIGTDAEALAGTDKLVAMTPYTVGLIAIAGAPLASEILAGIAELATQAETIAFTDDARIVTPKKLGQAFAEPAAIGSATPAAGTFTDLDADTTNDISLDADAASHFNVDGAGIDLTLSSGAGRVIVNGEEAADNAITLVSAAGGIDMDSALSTTISSSENTADAIVINASAGGIDLLAAGAAGEDMDITCTAGSVNITAGESAADSVVITSSIGGIDITCAGAAAGEDIDISSTGSSVNISASEDAADAITLTASAGGIDISATGAAGEDIDITATGSSVNVTATEDAANAIYLHANGGTSETVKIHSDLGTGVASIEVASDVGGVTISSGLASADAINITASDAAGGLDIDVGSNGMIVDSTGGAITLDADAASNFSVAGAGIDLTLSSAAGRVDIAGGEAVDDAVTIQCAAGGVDLDGALQVNIASSEAAADAIVINASAGGLDMSCDGAGLDVDIASTAGRVTVSSGEDAADAIYLHADAGTSETIRLHSDLGTGADSIELESDVGGITLKSGLASSDSINIESASGGLDIDCALDVVVTSTEDAADSIYLHANGGTSETVRVHSDLGTGVASVHLESDVGGVTLTSGLASDDAINLNASAGGVDVDGALQVNIASSEAAADAIVINASDASGGIDISTGGGSLDISSSGFVTMVAGTDTQAGDTCTINTNVGNAIYTGFTTAAAASQVFNVTNSLVSATSVVLVTVNTLGTNDAQLTVQRVKCAAGSFAVTCKNNGAAALNGNVHVNFWVFSA